MMQHAHTDPFAVLPVVELAHSDLVHLQGGSEDPGGDPGGGTGRWCLSCMIGRCSNRPLERSELSF